MYVIMMIQSYAQRERYRNVIKNIVYSAMGKQAGASTAPHSQSSYW